MANLIATELKEEVIVIDRRKVIAGNIYLYDNEWNRLNNVLYTWSHLYLDIDNCDGKFCQKDPNIVYQNSNIDVLDLRCRCEK